MKQHSNSSISSSVICCAGWFDYVPFFDPGLNEQFRISTATESRENLRLAAIHMPSASSSPSSPASSPSSSSTSDALVAISGGFSVGRSFPVLVYDLNSGSLLSKHITHRQEIRAMDCLGPSSSSSSSCGFTSSDPRVVSCGRGDSKLIVADAMSGKILSNVNLMVSPRRRFQAVNLVCVSEWEDAVFVGCGFPSRLLRFDVVKEVEAAQYSGGGLDSDVRGLAMSSRSHSRSRRCIFGADINSNAAVWSFDNAVEPIAQFELAYPAYSCFYDDDRDLLFVGLRDGGIEIWDPRNSAGHVAQLAPLRLVLGSHSPLGKQQYLYVQSIGQVSENCYVSGASDGFLSVWKWKNQNRGEDVEGKQKTNPVQTQFRFRRGVDDVCVIRDGDFLLAGYVASDEKFRFVRRRLDGGTEGTPCGAVVDVVVLMSPARTLRIPVSLLMLFRTV